MLKQINPNKNPLQNIKKGNINDVNNYINNVSKKIFIKKFLFIYRKMNIILKYITRKLM